MARAQIILIAVAIALLVPATASAAWLPIEEVGDIQFTDSETAMAANDRGDAVILLKDGRGMRAAVSRRGGAFGPPREVPGASGMIWDIGVELSEDGRALVHWRRFNTSNSTARGYVAGLKVDGGFGTTRSVTPAAPYLHFEPAIGPGGRFTVVYATGNGQSAALKPTYARSAPPSGRLGPRRTVATAGITMRDVWYAGLRPYVAYTRGGDRHRKLFERRLDPLGRARQIATVPQNGILALDTAANGTQAALWSSGAEDPDQPVFAAVRRAGGVFRGQELDRRFPPQELAVAVARSGAAVVAWQDFYEATTEDTPAPGGQERPGQVVTSYRAPAGSFGPIRSFRADTETTDVEGLNADIESDGLALVGLRANRFAGIQGRPYIATIDEGGEPDITPIGELRDTASAAGVTIDERARATTIWIDDGTMYAMRGDLGR